MKNRRTLITRADPEIFMVLPKEMLDEVKSLALQHGRSVNHQFVIMMADQLTALTKKSKPTKKQMDSDELLKMIFCTKGKEFKLHIRS